MTTLLTISANPSSFAGGTWNTAATAFNGGTNSLADGAYTVSLYNFTGPAGIALSTEAWTNVPG